MRLGEGMACPKCGGTLVRASTPSSYSSRRPWRDVLWCPWCERSFEAGEGSGRKAEPVSGR